MLTRLFEIRQLGPLSDWSMLAMVGGIVLIDVATLVAWEIEDQLQHTVVNLTEEVSEWAEACKNSRYPVSALSLVFTVTPLFPA